MLTNAYNTDFIDYNSPTAITLKGRLTRDYSIKTGTTDYDHWIVGYNPDALLMVWTGNDNNESTPGYSKITKNIWAEAIEQCLEEIDSSWYQTPDNVIGIPLNPVTGEYVTSGKSTMYYFVKGSEPEYYVSASK
jgi:membrane carboxypeptidase/penicillin-binding protein